MLQNMTEEDMSNDNIKIAWIGFAGVVAAALIAGIVALLGDNDGEKDNNPKSNDGITIQETSGNNSPVISGVGGDVIIGNDNQSPQTND